MGLSNGDGMNVLIEVDGTWSTSLGEVEMERGVTV